MLKLKVKKLHPDAKLPTKAYGKAAAFDLYALEDTNVVKDKTSQVRTGLAITPPKDHFCYIVEKSGLALKGFKISGGVCDEDYIGEYTVLVHPLEFFDDWDKSQHTFVKGSKVAQMLVLPVPEVEVEEVQELEKTERGIKGFGSSNNT